MRFTAALVAIAVIGGSTAAQPPQAQSSTASQCRKTTTYQAEQIGNYRGPKVQPKKLSELPAATAYMAVSRHISGCDAPLTMVDYRSAPRK